MIIPEELWPAIEDRQSYRLISDPWEDLLTNVEARANAGDSIVRAADADGEPEWRAKTSYLLANVLGIASERVNTTHSRRLAPSCANSDG